jgi:ligand-binding sensor domain-containing protein
VSLSLLHNPGMSRSLRHLSFIALAVALLSRPPYAVAAGEELPRAAGEFLIDAWTSDDGLPQNSVIAMAQTSDGYLWLSTFGGLA